MAPTGVAISDVRGRLFDAAERVLLRAGPSALTSRAVTLEAGCAKGVLHRHFADFDTFLAELVRDRIARIETWSAVLLRSAGTGTVADRLTGALLDFFDPVAVAVIGLLVSRDGLRDRLRGTRPAGVPVLADAVAGIGAYLSAERALGRIAPDADTDVLAPTLIGAAHLLFADRHGVRPGAEDVRRVVTAVVSGAERTVP